MQNEPLLLPSAKRTLVVAPPRGAARFVRPAAIGLGVLAVLIGAADVTSRLAGASLGDRALMFAFAPAIVLEAPPLLGAVHDGAVVPARLTIPSLGINAAIEQVGKKADGSMGTPQDYNNIAWYSLGAAPGGPGNAVFAGHVNNSRMRSGVFEHLAKVMIGDYITVIDAAGKTLVYEVTEIQQYAADEPPPASLFVGEGPSRLVLITCDGEWVPAERTFDRRFVVFAELAYR